MGAWSNENFGNDDASDWVYDLASPKGVDTLLSPIQTVVNSEEYLESPQCCEALAAAKVIAAAISKDYAKIPMDAQKWLTTKQGIFGKLPKIESAHAVLAVEATNKIISDSELKELWQETDNFQGWIDIQMALISRLSNVG